MADAVKIDLRQLEREVRARMRKIERAIAASEALGWFGQYGSHLASCASDGAACKVHLNYAASTAYVDRAQSYLDRAAQQMLPDVVAKAIEIANADIELAKDGS